MIKEGLTICRFSSGYGKEKIIDDLNIDALPKGKVIALLGPNGSGKSTLLRAMAGLNKTKGQLWLDGEDLMRQNFAQRANCIVYLPQSLPENVHLRVIESLLAVQHNTGKKVIDEQHILMMLERVGIAHLALHYLDELSGGQRQLVGLAQSLIRKPSIFLLDEPLSALDLNYQFHVMDLVKQETIARNIVTIIVVHDINIALRHSDYIIMLKQGNLITEGLPNDVITPENLAKVYQVQGRVEYCSKGYPFVIVDRLV